MTEATRTAAEARAAAELARWETEGGSPPEPHAAPLGDEPLLRRLGAAVVGEWNNLPTPLRRAVYERAVAVGAAPGGDAAMKRRMARFLHDHKRASPA
jgi:hypothetical protein